MLESSSPKTQSNLTPKSSTAPYGLVQILPNLKWLLGFAIIASGVMVVNQVQSYRLSFTQSEKLRAERKKLDNEWHRLLIEQQTFGATTQIGSRAVVSMGMYSPKPSAVVTLDVPTAQTE